jgi:hypothetical protein
MYEREVCLTSPRIAAIKVVKMNVNSKSENKRPRPWLIQVTFVERACCAVQSLFERAKSAIIMQV